MLFWQQNLPVNSLESPAHPTYISLIIDVLEAMPHASVRSMLLDMLGRNPRHCLLSVWTRPGARQMGGASASTTGLVGSKPTPTLTTRPLKRQESDHVSVISGQKST